MLPSLGLAMIVRDEAQDLPRCLASVQGLVAQMVIVDTGSQDNTREIAQAWGAEVIPTVWEYDFAQARNLGLAQLHTDWVLVLDADEVLAPAVKPKLQACLEQQHLIAVTLTREEIGVMPPYSSVSRLFRRHPEIYFNRPYHETIDDAVLALIENQPAWQIGQLEGVAIHHWGYTPERLQQRDKTQQAMTTMSQYLAQHPDDAYICAKLGGTYLQAGEMTLACQTLTQGLSLLPSEAAVLYELHYQLGNYHAQTGNLAQAIPQYQAAVAQSLALISKISAYLRLAQAWSQLKNYPQAIQAYETVIEIAPELPLAWQNLGVIYLKLGQVRTSLQYFHAAITRLQETDPREAARLQDELKLMGFTLP